MQLVPDPYLRWAGGKRWLVNRWSSIFPEISFNNYHEPFLGGGSVFMRLASHKKAFLSDLNPDLIETFQVLKSTPSKIIAVLETFENTEKHYYQIRATQFANSYERAARFIYLNQTSFNGIYRVNLNGKYNVPYGHRSKAFLDKKNLLSVSKALRNARLSNCDFADTLDNINVGDFVFLDPPYTISHNKNGFIKYNEKLFSLNDQIRLRQFIDELEKRQVLYILTNAFHPKIEELFKSPRNTATTASRSNLIGGKKAQRGATTEYIFSNICGIRDCT